MSIPFDVIRFISGFLSVVDIINVGKTCKYLYGQILDRDEIWFDWIITNWPDDKPLLYTGLRNTVEWKRVLFEHETLSKLAIHLAKVHLRIRFQEPPSSKKYFQLFYEVKSSDKRVPTKILSAVEINEDDDMLHMRFTHKDGSLIYWLGEGDIQSTADIYLVDRSSPQVKIYMRGSFGYSNHEPKFSLLSKKQYKEIGEILHNDPNYYGGESSTSYNYATGHGYHRSGMAPSGFGSNSKSYDAPNVLANCLVHVDKSYDPIQLYDAIAKK
jgi:hypothetical protein